MKRLLLLLCLAFALPAQAAEFYFYINADNDIIDLDSAGKPQPLTLLQQLGTQMGDLGALHIYYDPSSKIDGNGATLPTRVIRYYQGRLMADEQHGETDSTDPAWLSYLLSKSYTQHEPKILVFWGHGDNWRGIRSFDFSVPEKSFQYLSVADILAQNRVDIAIFDACQMGALEVLSGLSGKVPHVIASQFDLPAEGIFYGDLLNFLKVEKNTAGNTSVKGFAMRLYDSLRRATRQRAVQQGKPFVPIVYFDTTQFEAFRGELNRVLAQFASFLGAHPNDWKRIWQDVVGQSTKSSNGQADFRSIAFYIKKDTGVSTDRSLELFETMLFPQIDPDRKSKGYGSATLFMPLDYGLTQENDVREDAFQERTEPWLQGLENWNWVRTWFGQ